MKKWVFRSSSFDVVKIFGDPEFGGGKSLGVWFLEIPRCFGSSGVRRFDTARGLVPYNSSVIRSSAPYGSYRLGVSDLGVLAFVSRTSAI